MDDSGLAKRSTVKHLMKTLAIHVPPLRRLIDERNALTEERDVLKVQKALLEAELLRAESLRAELLSPSHDAFFALLKASFASCGHSSATSLRRLLEHATDEFLFWLLAEVPNADPVLASALPRMPSDDVQVHYTGGSGRATLKEASLAYEAIRAAARANSLEIGACDKIMDFGCGWGRIIRFFLRDVEPSRLYGVDIDPTMIRICNESNLKCFFSVIDPLPPLDFKDGAFDLIYLYSVFTHLPETAHLSWLRELARLLSPRGVLVATIRPRAYISLCSMLRSRNLSEGQTLESPSFASDLQEGPKWAARSFVNTQAILDAYDRGDYCHDPRPDLATPLFGETCIPQKYVERVWTEHFSRIDFMVDPKLRNYHQDIVVAKK
jgi:SAM-dependent methyltransferase